MQERTAVVSTLIFANMESVKIAEVPHAVFRCAMTGTIPVLKCEIFPCLKSMPSTERNITRPVDGCFNQKREKPCFR